LDVLYSGAPENDFSLLEGLDAYLCKGTAMFRQEGGPAPVDLKRPTWTYTICLGRSRMMRGFVPRLSTVLLMLWCTQHFELLREVHTVLRHMAAACTAKVSTVQN